MLGTYNFWLVAVSFIVAALASYTALDLTGRIALLASSRLRHAWLAGGAAAMGVGIWSMHFIAMLALSLPIPLGYDFALTGDSLAIAVVVSYFALLVTTRARLTPVHLVSGSVLMGIGIAGMHYTGMAAMRVYAGGGQMVMSGDPPQSFVFPLLLGVSTLTFLLGLTIAVSPNEDEILADAALTARIYSAADA